MSQLPILMYHNVCEQQEHSKGLTISVAKLESQLHFLKQKGYRTYHFRELSEGVKLASKSVVLTFDDVTVNQLKYAVPLLEKYQFKATFFVPFKYLGGVDAWNADGAEPLMSIDQLQGLPACIELGYHSYEHRHFADLSDLEIKEDFERSRQIISTQLLDVFPVMAYPYGNFPKKEPQRTAFFELMRRNGMKYGLRIGNKTNIFPFKEPFEIKRLDVKGEDSSIAFQLKLRFGKLF